MLYERETENTVSDQTPHVIDHIYLKYLISATNNCDALYKDQMLYVGESPVSDQALHVIDL